MATKILPHLRLGRGFALIFLLLPLLFSGCGGGTSGTGSEGSTRISGRVVDTTSAPLPNTQVTLLETGASGTTDSEGKFGFDSLVNDSKLTFSLERNAAAAEASVSGVPLAPEVVIIEFGFDEERRVATVNRAEIDPDPTPTPATTPLPSGDGPSVLIRVNITGAASALRGVQVRSNYSGVAPRTFAPLDPGQVTWGVLMRIPKIQKAQQLSFRAGTTLFVVTIAKIDPNAELIRVSAGLFPRGSKNPTFLRYAVVDSFPSGTSAPELEVSPRAPS